MGRSANIVASKLAQTADPSVPRVGVLILDTKFPRIVGDVGNPDTWSFPTIFYRVDAATPYRVAGQKAAGLLDGFIAGAKELARCGAAGIVTTCGFLALFQRELAEGLTIPVATSTLLFVPIVQRLLAPGRCVGVITYSKAFLTPQHFAAVGAPPDLPVEGVPPDGVFYTLITNGGDQIDVGAMEREVVDAGRRLVAARPDIGAIIVECANMPPYSAALRAALGLPVYDAVDCFNWFYAGLPVRRPADHLQSFKETKP